MLCGLGGCISLPQSEALRASPPAGLPSRVELTQVPFHRQDDFLCGLVAYTLAPQLEDVLREVAAGTPVVVLLYLAFKVIPVWHYAVIVGYDLEKREVIVRSAKKERDEWAFSFLEFFWQESGYWSMLALPPGRLPATAREPDAAAAIAALEQAGRRAEARESYRALAGEPGGPDRPGQRRILVQGHGRRRKGFPPRERGTPAVGYSIEQSRPCAGHTRQARGRGNGGTDRCCVGGAITAGSAQDARGDSRAAP